MSMACSREWINFLGHLDLPRDGITTFSSKVDCTVQECQLMECNERTTALMTLCMKYMPEIKLKQVQSIFKLFDNNASQNEDNSNLDEQKKEEKQSPRYPSLPDDRSIDMAFWSFWSPESWLPLFGHWFAIELYNVYLSVQSQLLESKKSVISLGNKYELQRSELDSCSENLKSACRRAHNGILRGNAVRSDWTSQCAPILNFLLFGSCLDQKGILLHQVPTGNNNRKTVDWYISGCTMGVTKLTDPKALGNGDLYDINFSACALVNHTQNYMAVRNATSDWPVVLAFPSMPAGARLYLHIPVDGKVWQLQVLQSTLYDKAFLCSLYFGVHRLLEDCIISSKSVSQPMKGLTPLAIAGTPPNKIRTFKKESRVFKFYDTIEESYKKPNIDIITSCGDLKNVKLGYLSTDKRLQCLSYDFIPGRHYSTSIEKFVGVLQTLHFLHEKNIVHGDVRLHNIVFDEHTSYLIDFDFADCVGELYPEGYAELKERHPGAVELAQMEKIHDRYPVQYIMAHCCYVPDPLILEELLNMEVSLIDIIARLRNLD